MKLGRCKECNAVVTNTCQLPEPYQNIYECEECGHPHTINELAPLHSLRDNIIANTSYITRNYILLTLANCISFDNENEEVDALLTEYADLAHEIYIKTDTNISYEHIAAAIDMARDNGEPITFENIQERAIDYYANTDW